MGVKDLWQLVSPAGRRISIETLEGKVLAIDASIWLTQFIKAMRDEDGKMVKNAHLIGTIRRILKLLHHRIRPVFVFDGATPSLKINVVNKRKKNAQQQEVSKRAAALRILQSQLRQHALKGQQNTQTEDQSPGKFADGFTLPTSKSIKINKTNSNSTKQLLTNNEDTDDVDWEEGYEALPEKNLSDSDDPNPQRRRHAHRRTDPEESQWMIPENSDDLDVDVLSGLPSHIRKSLIEGARKKERMKSRSNYLPVAGDPALYSQTQLANFLNSSKLNRRFEEVQKAAEGKSVGNTIAAEGHKKFLMIDEEAMAGGFFVEGSSSSSGNLNIGLSSDLNAASSSNLNGGSSSNNINNLNVGSSSKKTVINENEQESKEKIIDLSNDIIELSEKGAKKNRNKKKEINTEITKIIDLSDDLNEIPKIQNTKKPEIKISKTVDNNEITPQDTIEIHINPNIRNNSKVSLAGRTEQKEIVGEIAKDSMVEDDDFDDVDWKSESETESDNQPQTTVVESTNSQLKTSNPSDSLQNPIVTAKHSPTLENPETSARRLFPRPEEAAYRATENDESDELMMSVDVIDRAVSTASRMADWAGRAVRNALKEQRTKLTARSYSTGNDGNNSVNPPSVRERESPGMGEGSNVGSSGGSKGRKRDSQGVSFNDKMEIIDDSILTNEINTNDSDNVEIRSNDKIRDKSDFISDNEINNVINTTKIEENYENDYLSTENIEDQYINSNPETISLLHNASNEEENEEKRENQEQLRKDLRNERDVEKAARVQYSAAMKRIESLTDEMKDEVIQLVQAFDLPIVIAPYEAEAQCAVLEQEGLVDGVVTEDSDAFLFGAKSVYKNIFNDKKYVEVFLAEDLKKELGLRREDLVALAYFLGSDYTEGIGGIGIVNGMEIIQTFDMGGHEGPITGLENFKKWVANYDVYSDLSNLLKKKGSKIETAVNGKEEKEEEGKSNKEELLAIFEEKHRNGRSKWHIPDSFPNPLVAKAYLNPAVMENPFQYETAEGEKKKKIMFSLPQRNKVRKFCQDVLGWTEQEMDIHIDPVLKRFSERNNQMRMDSFYNTYHDNTRFAKFISERLKTAVVQITGKKSKFSISGSAPKPKNNKRKKKKNSNDED